MEIRKATLSDLDAIVRIELAASHRNPQWKWEHPHLDSASESYALSVKDMTAKLLENAGKDICRVVVAELHQSSTQPPIVVACSVYATAAKQELPRIPLEHSISTPKNLEDRSSRSGIEAAREDNIRARKAEAVQTWPAWFNGERLHLRRLATMPEYEGQGAAKMLIKWGQEEAEKLRIPITLFAHTSVSGLYTRMGFKTLGKVIGQVDGEKEFVEVVGMIWMTNID